MYYAIIFLCLSLAVILPVLSNGGTLPALKDFLTNSSDLAELAAKCAVSFLKVFGVLLFLYLSAIILSGVTSTSNSLTIKPFEMSTGSSTPQENRAMADSLVAAMYSILKVYESSTSGREPHNPWSNPSTNRRIALQSDRLATPPLPKMGATDELFEKTLSEIGDVSVADVNFPIGKLLLLARRMNPFGSKEKVISGSIERTEGKIRIVARLENGTARAWQAEGKEANLSEMLTNLSYMILSDISEDDRVFQTWQGFRYYTEGIQELQSFERAGQRAALDKAAKKSTLLMQVEPHSNMLSSLLCKLGITYLSLPVSVQSTASSKAGENQEPALTKFRQAIDVTSDPQLQSVALTGLSRALVRQFEIEASKKKASNESPETDIRLEFTLQDAITRDPQNACAYVYLGNYYFYKRKYDLAKGCYEKAIAIAPGFAWAHSNLGVSFFYLANSSGPGKFTDPDLNRAVEEWRRAITLDTTFALPHRYLGTAYLTYQSDFGENYADPREPITGGAIASQKLEPSYVYSALNHLKQVVRLDPYNFQVYPWMGDAYQKLGNLKLAEFAYRYGHQLAPEDPWCMNGLAQTLALQEDKEEAQIWWQKSLQYFTSTTRKLFFKELIKNAAGQASDPVKALSLFLAKNIDGLEPSDLIDAIHEIEIWKKMKPALQPKSTAEIFALLNAALKEKNARHSR